MLFPAFVWIFIVFIDFDSIKALIKPKISKKKMLKSTKKVKIAKFVLKNL